MSWMVSVVLPSQDIEVVSSLLWDLDTNGVAQTPTDTDAAAFLIAGFAAREQAEVAQRALSVHGLTASVEPYVPDWADSNSVIVSRHDLHLTLEVGAAFGHGSHPTTELCLDLLQQQLVASAPNVRSVLDVGTGTGVLAIAAARFGARPVVAVENDPAAEAIAAKNFAANEVDVVLHSRLDQTLPGATHPFDLLVANVLLADLRPLARGIGTASRRLILAGFLVDQVAEVLALFSGWTQLQRVESAGWAGLVLGRPARENHR